MSLEKRQLENHVKNVAKGTIKYLEYYIEYWGEDYESGGRREIEKVKTLEKTWIEKINNMNNSKLKSDLSIISKIETAFYKCWKRYYEWRRNGTIWEKKRKKTIKQRRKCELCGSKEKLEVHHMEGLISEKPEHLQVLCRKCHLKISAKKRKFIEKHWGCDFCGVSRHRNALEVHHALPEGVGEMFGIGRNEPSPLLIVYSVNPEGLKALCRKCHKEVLFNKT